MRDNIITILTSLRNIRSATGQKVLPFNWSRMTMVQLLQSVMAEVVDLEATIKSAGDLFAILKSDEAAIKSLFTAIQNQNANLKAVVAANTPAPPAQ